jgi:hypothetical protein
MEIEKKVRTQAQIICHTCYEKHVIDNVESLQKNVIHQCLHCGTKIADNLWPVMVEAIWDIHRVNIDSLNMEGEDPMFTVSVKSIITEMEVPS